MLRLLVKKSFLYHLLNVLLITTLTIVIPGVLVILGLWQVHRQIVARLLAVKYGHRFRGLLEGPDVVWAGENRSSRAMTNVLFLFKNTNNVPNAGVQLLEEFRKRIGSHLHDEVYQKMLWEIRQQWGYYFWLQRKPFQSVDSYVRSLEQVQISGSCVTRRELCELIGTISNRKCQSTSWELLVGTQQVRSDGQVDETLYPVLFRYHHSISDGIAILRLFVKDFIDDATLMSGQQLHAWNPEESNQLTQKGWHSGRRLLKLALTAPRFLIHELVVKRECNHFHGGAPGEHKITAWASEEPSGTPIVSTIKKIKLLLPGVSFTDVFLTAFALSLRSFCEKYGHDVPASLTLALMRRFERETKEIRLRNRSSAVFQTLPVGDLPSHGSIQPYTTISELLQQIRAVKKHSDLLNASTDPLASYLSVSYLPELLPAPIAHPLLARSKFSVAMSNIPAFGTAITVHGFTLKHATFWVPNIVNNMLGLTLLTVGGRLQIGLIADRRIIPVLDELDAILDGTIRELRNMTSVLQRASH